MEYKRIFTVIDDTIIFDAITIIEDSMGYIIHNNPQFNSLYKSNDLNYKYAWRYNINSDQHKKIIYADIKPITLSYEFQMIEQIPEINLIYLFLLNIGRFKQYHNLQMMTNGLIRIIGTNNKTIEMKIGRFINALVLDNQEFLSKHKIFTQNINTNTLERITNTYKNIACNNHLDLKIYSKQDILIGYTRSNYMIEDNSSSLCHSCMTNKHKLLTLYTNNDNIQLAVVYMNNKIIARTLIWTTTNMSLFYDKIYSNFDWVNDYINVELKKLNITQIQQNTTYNVKIKFIPNYFPYLDTLCYLNEDKMILSSKDDNLWDKKLTETDGGYYNNDNDNDNDEYSDDDDNDDND